MAAGGIDFIKDDELQGDGPHNPLEARIAAVMPVLEEHAARSGRKVMYAFNITGDIDDMLRGHDRVLAAGGTCVMVSLNAIGLPGLDHLRRHSELPIHGHRNGWGLYGRSPDVGISFLAYQKFWRLAGADHLHVNGLCNKFCEDDASVIASARGCQTPLFAPSAKTCVVMPVFSSGQTAAQAADTYAALGSTDLIGCCGGGVVAHPGGVAAGVASLRQARRAAVVGVALGDHARSHPELAQALEAFGARSGRRRSGELVSRERLTRALVAGGDTSGHTARQLGLSALTLAMPLAPGSPLCRGHAPGRSLDGLETALKGGQVGGPAYFSQVRDGGAWTRPRRPVRPRAEGRRGPITELFQFAAISGILDVDEWVSRRSRISNGCGPDQGITCLRRRASYQR